jgi:hypothetical protein
MVYRLSTTVDGLTASASITAAGGITLSMDASNGNAVTQVTWASAPQGGLVSVWENSPSSSYTFNGPLALLTSPVNLPDSGGSNAYPGGSGSTYSVSGHFESETANLTNGAFPSGCYLETLEQFSQGVTLP